MSLQHAKGAAVQTMGADAIYTRASSPPSEFSTHNESSERQQQQQSRGEPATFADLGVCQELCLACEALQWKSPTAIQRAVLPLAFQGRDIIGLAETGSGKTAAFAIPIVQALLDSKTPAKRNAVFALVMSPTRELSLQISDHFRALGCSVGLKVCNLVGGLDMAAQALELAKQPHVVVGSPGRVVDHLENTKGFNIMQLRYLVLDEADRLLSMDFEQAIESILRVASKDRITFLFSATMTSRVSKLQRASLTKPVKVEVSSKYDTAKNLTQHMKFIEHRMKWVFAVALLQHFRNYKIIIFVNTCLDTRRLALCLQHLGFETSCLYGKLAQPQRLAALYSFKSGGKRILVATEVGSRGLDIPSVDVVLNFDVPLGYKDYIHRVGRTARAFRSGRALTLVTQYDIETFQKIEHALMRRLEPFEDIPDDSWRQLYSQVQDARRLVELELKEAKSTKPDKKRTVRRTHKSSR